MSRYRFELAVESDDADLRRILAATSMPGAMSISFEREPSYFAAAVVSGRSRQTIVARDRTTGRLVAMGMRSITPRYVNGQTMPVGYLGELRLLKGHRRGRLLARGYAFLHDLHRQGGAAMYLTTIGDDNAPARDVLTSGRSRLPAYRPMGDYYTLAMPLSRSRHSAQPTPSIEIRPGRDADMPEILRFINEQGPRRQFFPCYMASDFDLGGLLRGLCLDQILLARRDNRLIGMLGGWDQLAYRQNIIKAYRGVLGVARPMYNLLAMIRSRPTLPAPGRPLRCIVGALPLVEDDDPAVWTALVHAIRHQCSDGRADYLLIGLHESDPLLSMLESFQSRCYTTGLYAVCWNGDEALHRSLDRRPIYLELGGL